MTIHATPTQDKQLTPFYHELFRQTTTFKTTR